jgi:hypothetical protein
MIAWVASCALGALLQAPVARAQPADIVFKVPGLYPESLTYYAPAQKFYVGSVKFGRVGTVDMEGHCQMRADDPGLISTFGVAQDPSHKRLLVCVADLGLSGRSTPVTTNKIARLAMFDIESGNLTKIVDLAGSIPGRHFANDVVADSLFTETQVQGVIMPDGSAYALRDKLEVLLAKKPDAESFSITQIEVK